MTAESKGIHGDPISESAPALLTHPRDRDRLIRMQGTPLVPQLVEMVSERFFERSTRLDLLRNAVQVGPRQYPDLERRLERLCNRLGMADKPDFYVSPDANCNAWVSGVRKHQIVATSGLLDYMTENEVDFILAHELGHARAEHMKWKMVAATLTSLGLAGITAVAQSTTGMLGGVMQAGSLAAALAATAAILDWSRAAEFTADRYGYLGIMDPDVSCMALAKLIATSTTLAGSFSISELENQAGRLEDLETSSMLGRLTRLLSMLEETHPMIPQRTVALREWSGSKVAKEVAAGRTFQAPPAPGLPGTSSSPPTPPPTPPPIAPPNSNLA